jgi:uncharacterized LabA/DUF88 family protein
MKTAILVDGGFYRKRATRCLGDVTPTERARELELYCKRHLTERHQDRHELYRIFYYDCPPMQRGIYHPLRKTDENFFKNPHSIWMRDFLNELRNKRKFALRLGNVSEKTAAFTLKPDITKKLFQGKIALTDITESDFRFTAQQKGVDMKIGIDIASMAYKKQVDQIILISGDSDFVPVAKLARREGIDFILDSLHFKVKDDLLEHIDGLRTCDNRFKDK